MYSEKIYTQRVVKAQNKLPTACGKGKGGQETEVLQEVASEQRTYLNLLKHQLDNIKQITFL